MGIFKSFSRHFRLISSASAFLISVIPLSCQHYEPSGLIENKDYDKKLSHMLDQSIPIIGVEELKKNKDVYTLLDVRSSEEFDVSHIQGAIHVDYEEFDISSVAQIDQSTPIVVYCSVGYRSEKVTEELIDAGYSDVKNLYGSIFEWVNRDYPIVTDDKEKSHKIHTYNKKWGQWMKNPTYTKIY